MHRVVWIVLMPATFLTQTQNPEIGRIERSGEHATIVVDGPRPLDSLAQTLATQYGVAVNAEDPEYRNAEDSKDVTAEVVRTPRPGLRVIVPRGGRLEVAFTVQANGAPRDLRGLLQTAVDLANARFPFWYRVAEDANRYTLIPTKTRNAQGEIDDRPALLDRKVTIPAATRKVFEHAQALADALSSQTGFHVSCCQAVVAGVPWGMGAVPFEARDEPARSVLARLMTVAGGRSYYLQRCDPIQPGRQTWCFINVNALPGVTSQ
jgi:hypothetical protein